MLRKRASSAASRAPEVKFTYFFASSLDGFIADAHGGVEWLDAFRTPDRFSEFNDFMSSVDGAVIGRKTYEQALVMTKGGKWPMPKIPCVVLSKTRSSGPHVEFWSKPLARTCRIFSRKGRPQYLDDGRRSNRCFVFECRNAHQHPAIHYAHRPRGRNSGLWRAGECRSIRTREMQTLPKRRRLAIL